ncbi:hypothetical protein [Alishewanella sp. SMS8]|uniref:hypothetical protein n=1 Tax=Alishewanella sp. SMS8 TaxID=2994676 RepID=UPI002740A917|nr:hypothetical protein [Alishewanella sp. SMS8]MDP5205851.1 hypothetical protein [Alishewanella sp. SMS9]MDP5459852.1 hypothetical protein [Alishewanella sp. SMS8]
MKNKLSDLNNHLFAQLERLGNETLKGEELAKEIDRSHAITSVAKEVISNARLVLDAQRQYDSGNMHKPHELLEVQKT